MNKRCPHCGCAEFQVVATIKACAPTTETGLVILCDERYRPSWLVSANGVRCMRCHTRYSLGALRISQHLTDEEIQQYELEVLREAART